MIRHISTVHKITSNVDDNFTVTNKDDIIIKPDKKIIEISLAVLPSDSIVDYIKDDNLKNTNNVISTTFIHTENISDKSRLIDMTDKNVQIDAQFKDIYTQIDVISDLENDLKVYNDTLDTHNNKINNLENELKVYCNTVDAVVVDNINYENRILKLENIYQMIYDKIYKLENINKILRDDFNKLENTNKSLHDENKRLYDVISKNNINI